MKNNDTFRTNSNKEGYNKIYLFIFFLMIAILSWFQKMFFQKNIHSKKQKNTLNNDQITTEDKEKTWIFVGLGNPGKEYEKTRHNAGLLLVEALKDAWDFPEFKQKGQVKWTQGFLEGKKIILAYPTTYMNLSGQGLSPFVRLHREAQWVILHDELDLPSGKIRFKEGGGHGGHNGLHSLEGIINNPYKRLRLGIGRPTEKYEVSNYVLHLFSKEQWNDFQKNAEHLLSILPLLIQGKKDLFVQELHR